jgi:RNA polymerase sigma factor (sigma-70 family)
VETNELTDHLSRIKTRLTVWLQAHQGEGEAAIVARQQLVLRYYGAVYRYLLGMLRDPTAAEEMTQEFAVRLLRGDFKRFDPQRGRFRDFLKVSLRHLVQDYWRQQKKRKQKEPQLLSPEPAGLEPSDPARPAGVPQGTRVSDRSEDWEVDLDRGFVEKWKEELLARTWEALEKSQEETQQPYYTVLRCKTDQPELRSAQLAEELSGNLGRPVTGEGARQLLHRARQRFAELLVDEVAHSLHSAEPGQVAEELIELGLMSYCRSAVSSTERP